MFFVVIEEKEKTRNIAGNRKFEMLILSLSIGTLYIFLDLFTCKMYFSFLISERRLKKENSAYLFLFFNVFLNCFL